MVHVSEMSWTRRVRHPSEIVGLDEEIDVMVLNVSPDEEKIALGIKQTQPNPWMEIEHKYPIGTRVNGVVRNLADYGAFVQIEEGIDGLLHVSDLSWTQKVSHPSEVLEKNQEVVVQILSIDPAHEKISVGLKQLQEDPWDKLMGEIKVGSDLEVEIAKLVSFGAFAKLDGGIEGLIHVSEIGQDVQKPEEALSIDDKVTARVISIDAGERKIGLSIRAYLQNEDAKLKEEFGTSGDEDSTSVSVTDAVGDAVPSSLLSAGGTLADAANKMMAAVSEEPKVEATPTPAPTEPAPTEPAPTEPAPTEPAPTEPAPTEPAPTEPAPTESAPTESAPTESEPAEVVEEVVVEPADEADAPEKPESDG